MYLLSSGHVNGILRSLLLAKSGANIILRQTLVVSSVAVTNQSHKRIQGGWGTGVGGRIGSAPPLTAADL